MLKHITESVLSHLRQEASLSARRRKNLNYHDELSDTLQRMLHAMNPGTYVQPHKHENPDKREAFIILTGRIAVLEFNDAGEVIDKIILDPKTGNYGTEIPPRTWHSLIALEPGSVVYEVKDGPYQPIDDKNFAPWAPTEGDAGCEDYLNTLISNEGLE